MIVHGLLAAPVTLGLLISEGPGKKGKITLSITANRPFALRKVSLKQGNRSTASSAMPQKLTLKTVDLRR